MDKILITGANGFIGKHLVSQLIQQGVKKEKLRLFIEENDRSEIFDNTFDVMRSDIRNRGAVKKAVEGVSVIYHLAARIGFDGKKHTDYEAINVDGTRNILDQVKSKKIQKFVFFSTVAVFGLPAYIGDIRNWNENHTKEPKEEYGRSKLEAEEVIGEYYRRYGVPYTIIRPTSVYGPGDVKNMLPLFKTIKGGYFFYISNGENKLDYVFVEDLVNGAINAAKSKKNDGDYILGGGDTVVALKNIVKDICLSLHKNVPTFKVPTIVGYGIGHAVDAINKTFRLSLPLSPGRVRAMTSDFYFDISKAKKELSYNPKVSFSQGASASARWYLENKLL